MKQKEGPSGSPFHIRLPEGDLGELAILAAEHDISTSDYIRLVLKKHLRSKEPLLGSVRKKKTA